MNLPDYSVLVLYNTPRSGTGAGGYLESDAGVLDEVHAVESALRTLGVRFRSVGVKTLAELPAVLGCAAEPLVFNLVEGFHVRPEEACYVPTWCEGYGKMCTGNDSAAILICTDKWKTKGLLRNADLACPEGHIVYPGHPVLSLGIHSGKVIVKPMATDASEGIDDSSVLDAADLAGVRACVSRLHEQFRQPVLIERFVGERELNVSVVRRGNTLEVLPIAEIDFSAFGGERPRIVGYAAKWLSASFEYNHTPRIIPAPLSATQAELVRQAARDAWNVLGCRDYARVDFRLSDDGEPVILEVNPNPDISPDAGFAAALAAAGMPYQEFVAAMLENALCRLQARVLPSPAGERKPAKPAAGGADLDIRYSEARDRDPIVQFLGNTGFFRPDEMTIAAEVLDDALAKGPEGHYQSFTASIAGRPVGWICYGPTPCTLGTYDIYWIGVDPTCQGKGIGRLLMEYAEERIRRLGGRLVVVETSGRAIYDATRAFYLRVNYTEATRLPEFYAPNDDKVVYLKRL
jgi:D-alanine-D-alanine ligase